MKLSKKKSSKLYGVVHDDIMTARIKIANILAEALVNRKQRAKVEDVLSKLCYTAPQKAIDLFNLPNSKQES